MAIGLPLLTSQQGKASKYCATGSASRGCIGLRCPAGWRFPSDFGALARSLPKVPRLNENACLQMLTLTYPVDDATCFEEIRLVSPDSALTFQEGRVSRKRLPSVRVRRPLGRGVARREVRGTGGGARCGLRGLVGSGRFALDRRPFVGERLAIRPRGSCSGTGSARPARLSACPAARTSEERSRSVAARDCGMNFSIRLGARRGNHGAGRCSGWASWPAISTVPAGRMTGVGRSADSTARWCWAASATRSPACISSTAFRETGSPTGRPGALGERDDGSWAGSDMLRREARDRVRGLLRTSFLRACEDATFGLDHQKALHLDLLCRQRRATASQINFLSDAVPVAPLLYSRAMIDFWSNLPYEDLRGQSLYLDYARARFPTLFAPARSPSLLSRARGTTVNAIVAALPSLRARLAPPEIDVGAQVAQHLDRLRTLVGGYGDVVSKIMDLTALHGWIDGFSPRGSLKAGQLQRFWNLLLLVETGLGDRDPAARELQRAPQRTRISA